MIKQTYYGIARGGLSISPQLQMPPSRTRKGLAVSNLLRRPGGSGSVLHPAERRSCHSRRKFLEPLEQEAGALLDLGRRACWPYIGPPRHPNKTLRHGNSK